MAAAGRAARARASALWATPARAAHRPHAGRRCCCGAAGCSSPRLVFSSQPGRHPHLLHGRAGAGDRARWSRSAARCCGAPRSSLGARSLAALAVLRHRGVGVRAARPHADLGAVAARLVIVVRRGSRRLGLLARPRRRSARRALGAPRWRVLARVALLAGPGRVRGADDRDRPHRLDPLGRAGGGAALGGGGRRRSGRAARRCRRARARRRLRRRRARRSGAPRRRRRAPARARGSSRSVAPAARLPAARRPARLGGARPARRRAPAAASRQQRARQGARARRRPLPLGGGDLGLPDRGEHRARDRRRAGDGDRRLQRQGRQAEPGAVRAVRRRAARSTTTSPPAVARAVRAVRGGPGGGAARRVRRRVVSTSAITSWVEAHFKSVDDRRPDGLRPDPAQVTGARSGSFSGVQRQFRSQSAPGHRFARLRRARLCHPDGTGSDRRISGQMAKARRPPVSRSFSSMSPERTQAYRACHADAQRPRPEQAARA